MANHVGASRTRSFPSDIKEGNVDVAVLIDHLRPVRTDPAHHRRGLETWAVDWSADGHYLAWSQGNKIVQLIPWNKYRHCRLAQDNTNYQGQKILTKTMMFDAGNLVWSVALGPKDPEACKLEYDPEQDGLVLDTRPLILAVGALTDIKAWSVHTGELMYLLAHHKVLVRVLKFAPDGSQRILGGSRDGSLSLWDLEDDARLLQTFQGFSMWIFGCAWSPNCDLICGVGGKEMVMLWKLDDAKQWQLKGHRGCVTACDFSPDGALLATSSFDTTVIIWDPHTQTKLKTLYHCYSGTEPVSLEHMDWYVRHVTFSWDSRYLVSVCEDRFVRFWDLATPDLPKQVALVSNPLCCSFSPDGIVLAVGNRNGTITIWLSILEVPTLQHLCRMSIRRVLHSTHLDLLNLPSRIRRYLKYFEEPPSQSLSNLEADEGERSVVVSYDEVEIDTALNLPSVEQIPANPPMGVTSHPRVVHFLQEIVTDTSSEDITDEARTPHEDNPYIVSDDVSTDITGETNTSNSHSIIAHDTPGATSDSSEDITDETNLLNCHGNTCMTHVSKEQPASS